MPEIFSPYWQTTDKRTCRIYVGDVRETCLQLPYQSIQTIVTSPPYWGLRDYKTGSKFEIGSEPLPDCNTSGQAQCGRCFVCIMVEVFRSVRRLLRSDGTLWLNLGDTYASAGSNRNGKSSKSLDKGGESQSLGMDCRKGNHGAKHGGVVGIPKGNLIGIPWRVALALQADGWILRQEIIWHKPNPMPDSVKNRCTKGHEQIFLFAKKEGYFFDNEAIKEPSLDNESKKWFNRSVATDHLIDGKEDLGYDGHRTRDGIKNLKQSGKQFPMANKRSVWTVSTYAYPGAHYATFPPKLIEPCILAGTSEKGACRDCGAPWRRVVKTDDTLTSTAGVATPTVTTGWKPTCQCGTKKVRPCVVLDPFFGSGTTAEVCIKHGRRCIGIELSPKYAKDNAIPRVCRALQTYTSLQLDLIPDGTQY